MLKRIVAIGIAGFASLLAVVAARLGDVDVSEEDEDSDDQEEQIELHAAGPVAVTTDDDGDISGVFVVDGLEPEPHLAALLMGSHFLTTSRGHRSVYRA